MSPIVPKGKILVQFDGVCILCSRTVNFILKADKQKKFLFQTLQSSALKEPGESVIVSDGQTTYSHFDAVLKIAEELGGIYKLTAIFKLIPRKWRHSLYLWIARNRYRWFGVRESCYLPSAEVLKRFI
ncbi:MAG: DCC1-like thiol-disulfide oxidoreductase family protein [Bacteroidota bacterium]|nr:DCC1-like thiol-disulfide oxidoreductase family protein [Bacteroidota bacterium]